MSGHSTEQSRSVTASVTATLAFVAVAVLGVAAAWVAFVWYPADLADVLGVAAVVVAMGPVLWFASSVAGSLRKTYNVAEVGVEGPIARERGGGPLPSRPAAVAADDVVEQIDRADADSSVRALLVKLNTPGGEIVPSEDVRLAVERFDGPTVGYATDRCASGGYDVATACDAVFAREGTLVGSIGVIGSRVNAHDLAERLGVSYERFTAGEYKDAGTPLKELDGDDRAYLQGIVDDYYDQFVETVADGRDLDRDDVEDTEARVYLGERALELDLVDHLGARRAVEDHLEDRLGEPVTVERFEPARALRERLRGGAATVAFALGAGVANAFGGDRDGLRFR